MTPVEAEEVLKRFRDEEEARQKEMEAQATNPTVADLAEGLGVSHDRIAALLAQVRRDAPQPVQSQPISTVAAQEYVRRQNTSAWVIALIILSVVALAFMALLLTATSEIRINDDPATVVTPAPGEATAPAPTAPSETP